MSTVECTLHRLTYMMIGLKMKEEEEEEEDDDDDDVSIGTIQQQPLWPTSSLESPDPVQLIHVILLQSL